ncbi:ABC transporter permease [Halomarina litorea]|uniref:ABC transporter permease n=1 Tax=Halomarina litorea TaxID=2961595 RepID=UPI0020C588A4|nr:ABC transporter permease subunit [Halomarina sp. BCD28]
MGESRREQDHDPVVGDVSWRVDEARRLAGRYGPAALLFVSVLAAWEAATVVYAIPTVVLPSPTDVGAELVASWRVLLGDAAVTGATAALGLLGGVVVGLLVAFGMTVSRTVELVARPFVVGLRIAPLVAIAPLLFLWFGRGLPARALLVTTLTQFPVAVASVGGLRAVPDPYLDLARSVDASPLRTFLRVRVPAAAPSVLAGVKLAAALSVIGTVVSEFVTLTAGLGYRVFVTSTALRTDRTYAALAALVALGLAFYLLPAWLERRTAARGPTDV